MIFGYRRRERGIISVDTAGCYHTFCFDLAVSGSSKRKKIQTVYKQRFCQRISDERSVLRGIFCDGDSSYQYKKPESPGKQYAEYYYFILLGAKTTYIFTILVFVCLLAVLAASAEALLLGLLLGGLAIAYLDLSLQDKLTARRQELVLDLPQVLSKLTLLVNSGMVLRDAWKRVSVTGDRALYQEMRNTSMEIENGVMETDAYRNFAERCNVKEIRKFASLIIQNLKKGNEELAYFLKDLSDEMWEVKKNEVKQKGEKANSRLLLPMMLIFIGILIMILVPVFQQMG